jgi:hypothetical protein
MPALELEADIEGAKVLSEKAIEFRGWVGIEKVLDFQAELTHTVGRNIYVGRGQKLPKGPARARVLDLRKDVRRLILRCQSPRDQWKKWQDDFDKILENMKLPRAPMDPIVVPVDPAKYKPRPRG